MIFADEPTGNLDSSASAEVLEFLRRSVSEHGQSIVMVTHDPRAAAYADRVVFLADGRVVGELHSPTADSVLEQMMKLGRQRCVRSRLRGLLARKLRLALTALAIVLGVTFVTGTLVLTDTLNHTFNTLVGSVYQHVNFEIRGKAAFNSDTAAAVNGTADRKPVPESIADGGSPRARSRVCRTGRSSGYAQFVAPDGNAIGRCGLGARVSRSTPTRSCRLCGSSRAAPPPPPMRW